MFLKLRKIELRLCEERIPYEGIFSESHRKICVRNAEDVYRIFKYLGEKVQEEVHALYLDTKGKIIGLYLVSKGSMTFSAFTPADVLRPALLIGAQSIILVHNHPSGSPEPSVEDREITFRIKSACVLLGLTLNDHLVIVRDGFKSCV